MSNRKTDYVVINAKDWPVFYTDDLADAIRVCAELQADDEDACIIDTKKGVIVEW